MKIIEKKRVTINYGDIECGVPFRHATTGELYLNTRRTDSLHNSTWYACHLSTGKLVKLENDDPCVIVNGSFVEE